MWGIEPAKLHQHLHTLGAKQAAAFLQQHSGLINQLAEITQLLGSEYYPLISEHADQLLVREQSYGQYQNGFHRGFLSLQKPIHNGRHALQAP